MALEQNNGFESEARMSMSLGNLEQFENIEQSFSLGQANFHTPDLPNEGSFVIQTIHRFLFDFGLSFNFISSILLISLMVWSILI